MPIAIEDLKITNPDGSPVFIVLGADDTVADALARLPRRRSQRAYTYVVVPLPDRTFLVPRWIEVELLAAATGRDIRAMRIADLPALLPQVDPNAELDTGGKRIRAGELPKRFTPVQGSEHEDTSEAIARQKRGAHPAQRLVILKDGQVLGLFLLELLSGSGLPPDPFESAGPAVLNPDAAAPVLADRTAGAEAPAPAADNRQINGWLEGWGRDAPAAERAWRQIARDEPLLKGQTYELKLEVDAPRATAIISGGNIAAAIEKLKDDQDELTILVELVVDEADFRVFEEVPNGRLIVPREVKPSKNRVTFSLEPLKTGQLSIKVVCYALKELFLEREVKVAVTDDPRLAVRGAQKGAIVVEERGVTLAAAISRAPRGEETERVSLYIDQQQDGYKFILMGAGSIRATVRLDKESVSSALMNARKEFHDKFILKKDDGVWLYLEPDPAIPEEIYRADLEELAFIGRDLFQTLFYGRLGEPTAEAKAMGDRLRELSRANVLDIKIVSDRFAFPWQLIYDRPDDGSPVDPDGFWGFKHIIEFVPEFSAGAVVSFGNDIAVSGRLPVATVFDERIDAQFGFPVIAEQRATLRASDQLDVKELTKTAEVLSLFGDVNAPPLIYLYVHNESLYPAEADKKRPELPVGTDGGRITTSEGELLLRDIKRRVSVERPPFKNAPLIFLNACQGAELQPGQFDGLLPYLMQRGARGAIGTEVNTPVNFAARFGAELVAELARGEKPLGALLRERRRFYRDTHHNIMGLIYALYCSGDAMVVRS